MRVTTTKSKSDESFYINYAFINEKGKSTSRIYKKLGKLSELSKELNTDRDGVMAWAKEQARIETEKYKKENESVSIALNPNIPIKKDQQNTFNCGYLFLQSIYYSLHLDNICRNIKNRHDYEYDLNAILSDLIYARFLNPTSKLSSFKYCHSLLEQPTYHLHDIYRALTVLAEESDYIQAELYRNSNYIHKRNTRVLYYDCTNYYFEIEQERGDAKYGKNKENKPNPIVGMGLFMDADGFPLSFDLFPGDQNEQLTLKDHEHKVINDFRCSQFVYCSDSGLGSKKNRLLNTTGGRAYVITQSLKKLKKDVRETALSTSQYRKIGSNKFIDLNDLDEEDPEVFNSIYYKEIPYDSNELSETLIVTYSPKYRKYQASIRQNQIQRAQKMITDSGKPKKNRKNPNDPARFLKKQSFTDNGELAEDEIWQIDQEVIEKEAMYDGFYAVVTNLDDDVQDIIAINKRRWQIEECFRILKSDFDARPVYLRDDDRIKAHFLICFMALLFFRILENKLEYKYTADKIVDTMKKMNLTLLEGYGYIPSYTRTDITDDLHKLFGFRTDYQITKKQKMRNIIHQTKDKKKYYNPQQRKKVAQCLYTRALDHFISFLAVKDRIITNSKQEYHDVL